MQVTVVTPTYNEKGNIIELLDRIKALNITDLNVLVVDDNSPDGTAEIVRDYQQSNKFVHLITGEKQGLGVAYVRGFGEVLRHLKSDAIITMDADLSHPPELIPNFIKKLRENDVVIGSRYIKGGGTPDWGIIRKLISFGGNMFARFVAGLYKVHDCTSGYRGIKVDALRNVKKDALGTKGYAFQITLLYELLDSGSSVAEIPLVFPDRTIGKSKLKTKDIIEFFINSIRIRYKRHKQLIQFGTVGMSGAAINTTMLFFFTEYIGIHYRISAVLGFEFAVIWNFTMNSLWTFRDNINDTHVAKKLMKFHTASLSAFIVNYSVFLALTYFGLNYIIANLFGIVSAFMINYTLNAKWTWNED